MRYPVFLDLTDQVCVVVGGGRVAARKIRTLLAAKAKIIVICPDGSDAVRQLAEARRIRWSRRRYRSGDLRGARLVIAATDDQDVNRQICADAKRLNLPVNCIAPPDAGNFIVPALVRRGPVAVAISTGGASPALAKQMRRRLEDFVDGSYAELASKMRKLRKQAGKTVRTTRQRAALYRRTVRRLLRGR
jgi:precorrin-2 dehydrogenase/sirohydrochlorin ferrochelatase